MLSAEFNIKRQLLHKPAVDYQASGLKVLGLHTWNLVLWLLINCSSIKMVGSVCWKNKRLKGCVMKMLYTVISRLGKKIKTILIITLFTAISAAHLQWKKLFNFK